MTTIFEQSFRSTIENLPEEAREVWLFEGSETRRLAEQSASRLGRDLRLRSAYKTLLHEVIETGILDGAATAVIYYPVVEGCPEDRFLLECYPLHALCSGCQIEFRPNPHEGPGLPAYRIETGGQIHEIKAPVRWRKAPDGSDVLAACGWMIDNDGNASHLSTEYEEIFDAACATLSSIPLDPVNSDEADGPYFERLEFHVSLPVQDQRLPVGNEAISLTEALHEEIYFSALEIFRQRLELEAGARSVKCGQVVPLMTYGPPSLEIRRTKPRPEADSDQTGQPDLAEVTHWLYPSQIAAHLSALGGIRYGCRSRHGRPVEGCFVEGRGSARLAISAGQHSNETSPVIGALRAAADLAREGDVSFTLNPLENPDGYAAFRELSAINPGHMQHAARYTASGADIQGCNGSYESAIRDLARQHLPATVHVNLHGYPAHEWTRPLSGYIPAGFGQWTIPKGFFLILRYDPEYADLAHKVLDAALTVLAEYPPLAEQNRQMLERYRSYVSLQSFEVFRDCIPFMIRPEADPGYPVTLITEAADETIYGEDFRIAHEGQYRVLLSVADALQDRL